MARGISLHVGINRVSVAAFSAQPLLGPENDAEAMRGIALSRGVAPEDARLLLGQDATFENVKTEILRAAGLLVQGDTFLFTFAGHGSRIPDEERLLSEEPDRKDEALVLFDRLLLDDYLRRVLWPEFAPGVRIIGVTDSCHSATSLLAMVNVNVLHEEHRSITASSDGAVVTSVTRVRTVETASPAADDRQEGYGSDDDGENESNPGERVLDPAARKEHREVRFKEFYDGLNIPSPASARPVGAGLLLMAACEDNGKTLDGPLHGVFTQALLDVWDGGAFSLDYVTFMQEISAKLPNQVPKLTLDPSPGFSDETPFTI